MSVRLLSDYEIGLIAGFTVTNPCVLPSGWTSQDLARRIRAANLRAFTDRYPDHNSRDLTDSPDPVAIDLSASVLIAAQDAAYNVMEDGDVALALAQILRLASK